MLFEIIYYLFNDVGWFCLARHSGTGDLFCTRLRNRILGKLVITIIVIYIYIIIHDVTNIYFEIKCPNTFFTGNMQSKHRYNTRLLPGRTILSLAGGKNSRYYIHVYI